MFMFLYILFTVYAFILIFAVCMIFIFAYDKCNNTNHGEELLEYLHLDYEFK